MKMCFFIGHRDAPEKIKPLLAATVERHIVDYGVTEFLVGRYGNFDRLAAAAVIAAKKAHPQIRLTLLLPYHPVVCAVQKPSGFDETCYPPNMESVPRRFGIVHANRYSVTQADYVIAYVNQAPSNARNIIRYAVGRGVTVENLADPCGDAKVKEK